MSCSRSLALLVFLVSAGLATANAEEPGDALGYWLTEMGRAVIEIYEENGGYFGRIAAQKDPLYLPGEIDGMDGRERVDLENPDPELRNRPIQGMTFMTNFAWSKGKFRGGKIYDAETGKTWRGQFWLEDEETLKLRGYIGISLFGRNTMWTRAIIDPWTSSAAAEDSNNE